MSRLRHRLDRIAAAVKPPGRFIVMHVFDDDPEREQKIAAFKTENSVTPSDTFVVLVTFFADE